MTNSPDQEPRRSRWRSVLRRTGTVVLVVGVAGVAGGAAFGWYWLKTRFPPFLSATLSEIAMRPVQVGPLEQIGWSGLRFGESGLLPTAADPDEIRVDAVEVGFDLGEILDWSNLWGDRAIPLDLNFVNPRAYIEQDNTGALVKVQFKPPAGDLPVQIRPTRLRFTGATATVMPAARLPGRSQQVTPIALRGLAGTVELEQWQGKIPQSIRLALDGATGEQGSRGGEFDLRGEYRVDREQVRSRVRLAQIGVADFGQLLPGPVAIASGELNATLEADYDLAQGIPHLLGTVRWEGISAQVLTIPGAAPSVDLATATNPALPTPTGTVVLPSGRLRLRDRAIAFEEVVARYGSLAGRLNGEVDLNGSAIALENWQRSPLAAAFDLDVQLRDVRPEEVATTVGVELPITVDGVFDLDANLAGNLDDPRLTGRLAAVTPTTQIDRLTFAGLRTRFAVGRAKSRPPNLNTTPQLPNAVPLQDWPKRWAKLMPLRLAATEVAIDPVGPGNLTASAQVDLDGDLRFNLPGLQTAHGASAAGSMAMAGERRAIAPPPTPPLRSTTSGLQWVAWQPQSPTSQRAILPLAIPQDSISQDSISQDSISQNSISQDSISQDSISQDSISQNSISQRAPGLPNPLPDAPPPTPAQGAAANTAPPIQLNRPELRNLQASMRGRSLPVGNWLQAYGMPPLIDVGAVDLDAQVQGPPADVQAQVRLGLLGGTVTAQTRLQRSRFSGSADWQGVQLQNLLGTLPSSVPAEVATAVQEAVTGAVAGEASWSGAWAATLPSLAAIANPDNFQITNLQASARTRTTLAGGQLAGQVALRDRTWTADGQASGVNLGAFLPPELGVNLSGQLSATGQARGTLAANLLDSFADLDALIHGISADGSAEIRPLASGSIQASARLRQGRWDSTTTINGLQLAQLVPAATGRLDAAATASGSLRQLNPGVIAATATGTLSPGDRSNRLTATQSDYLDARLPFRFDAAWDGHALQLRDAAGTGLRVSGTVVPNFADVLQTRLALNVGVDRLDLAPLPTLLPIDLPPEWRDRPLLVGRANFDGRLVGTLTAPEANGQLRLVGLEVVGAPFDPLLAGSVRAGLRSGVALDLEGDGSDRLALNLNSQFRPQSFDVRWDGAIATGQARGNLLDVSLSQLNLDRFELPPALLAGYGPVRGWVTVDGSVNLDNFNGNGTLTVDQPGIGVTTLEQFTAQLAHRDRTVSLREGLLTDGPSRYHVEAALKLRQDPEFEGKVQVEEGRIGRLLALAQVDSIEAIAEIAKTYRAPNRGDASDLDADLIATRDFTLLQQLRKIAEIRALLDRQILARCQANPFPSLSRFQGAIAGNLNFAGTFSEGIAADFDFAGENWSWLPEDDCAHDQLLFNADRVAIRGDFRDGTLALVPLRFESGATTLAFSGQLGENQAGQLLLTQFPAEAIMEIPQVRQIYAQGNLPELSGNVDLTAAIAGSLDDPRARGQVELTDGKLNDTPIRSAVGNFSYSTARLNFASQVAILEAVGEDTRPIQATGSIPYQLPFATVPPETHDLSLKASIQDEELGLVSLVAPQVTWLGGEGKVDVEVQGTLDRPEITGSAVFKDGKVAVEALPDPVQGITGRADFAGDRIRVAAIQGTLGQGQVEIKGDLPIVETELAIEDPLTVALKDLSLNLRDLFQGNVAGDIAIKGSALKPKIGGKIALSRGRVILPSDPNAVAPATTTSGGGFSPQFDGLQIDLGRGIEILKLPVLAFFANGTLTINGTLENPEPLGTVRLLRGRINLFTTQFFLERGEDQFAAFVPQLGLDPYLKVNLVAFIPEVQGNPFQTDNTGRQNPAEIRESVLARTGTVQTVRVRATVDAPASTLLNPDSIELSSRPSRSQAQILALIGGSLFGGDDSGLALVNVVGAGLFNTIQNNIATAIGLTDFRVYPTTVEERRRRGDGDREDDPGATSLGVALEAGMDISDNLSASIATVFAEVDTQVRLNLNYRVGDSVTVRGATDFRGDTRGVIQFEKRF